MRLLDVHLNWFWRSLLLKLCLAARNRQNPLKPILAFRVTQGNQEPVYDFPLVINSNLGPILHRYSDTATYWLKITNFFHFSHLAPSFGVTPFEFMEKLYGSWN